MECWQKEKKMKTYATLFDDHEYDPHTVKQNKYALVNNTLSDCEDECVGWKNRRNIEQNQ